MKPDVVLTVPIYATAVEQLDQSFTVHRLWQAKHRSAFFAEIRDRVRAIATGAYPVNAELMSELPKTEIIATQSVGVDHIDLAAAEDRFAALKQRFGPAVDLIHGRLKGAEKDAAMARFAAGETQLLVATTVIEVGVDVPEASVMVIEHAERFGLAQLHQLRGRIGRGAERSTCLLLYKAPLGPTAKARLAILRETDDGFRIAEEDLKLRGEGDVLGTRQSGMPGFHIARIEFHGKLLPAARDDAALVLSRDPQLTSPRGEALRALLYLFARDEAIRLLGAG